MRASRSTHQPLPSESSPTHVGVHCLAEDLLDRPPLLDGKQLEPLPPFLRKPQRDTRQAPRSGIGPNTSSGCADPLPAIPPLPCILYLGAFAVRRCRMAPLGQTRIGWPRGRSGSRCHLGPSRRRLVITPSGLGELIWRTLHEARKAALWGCRHYGLLFCAVAGLSWIASKTAISFQSCRISRAALLVGSNSPTACPWVRARR